MSLPSPEEGGQLLYQAALYDNVDLLEDLLSGEFIHQLDWRDNHGRTALHVAAASGHTDCVKILVAAGAEVNIASDAPDGYKTPLQAAAEAGHTDAVRVLAEAGANVFAQNRNGYCALELAQMTGNQETACALLDAVENRYSRIQRLRDKLEKVCTDSGDATQAEDILGSTGRDILPEVINGSHEEDYSMLYRAAESGRLEIVKLLLKYGADGRIHPVTLYSPLYVATNAGHYTVVQLLLQNFPEWVHRETFEQWLPLHAACKRGDGKLVKLLLSYPYPDYILQSFTDPSGKWSYKFAFDINCQDVDCCSPLYVACQEGAAEVVRVLLDFTVEAFSGEESPVQLRSPEAEESYEEVVFREVRRSSEGSESKEAAGDTPVKKARSRLNVLPAKQQQQQTTRSGEKGSS